MSVPLPAKAEIVRRGLKIRDVAADIGVNPQALGEILNRRRSSWPALRDRLSELLNVPEEVLFGEPAPTVVDFVRRTSAASGVPEKLTDDATAGKVAQLLRGAQ